MKPHKKDSYHIQLKKTFIPFLKKNGYEKVYDGDSRLLQINVPIGKRGESIPYHPDIWYEIPKTRKKVIIEFIHTQSDNETIADVFLAFFVGNVKTLFLLTTTEQKMDEVYCLVHKMEKLIEDNANKDWKQLGFPTYVVDYISLDKFKSKPELMKSIKEIFNYWHENQKYI